MVVGFGGGVLWWLGCRWSWSMAVKSVRSIGGMASDGGESRGGEVGDGDGVFF